jgi:hypothetical protein
MLSTFAGWCHFGDQRPRSRDVSTNRQTNEDEANDNRPRLDCENQPEHSKRVEQHIILIYLLAPEEIAQSSADESAEAG